MELDFFTLEGLATLAGATAAVKIATTAICNQWPQWDPRRVAGVAALLVQIFVWLASAQIAGRYDWVSLVLALLMAPAVYIGATGINAMTAARLSSTRAAGRIDRGSAPWWN